MPDFDDPDQEAKDHGNLMDEGVAEVESEAAEAQMAEEDSEPQNARNGPSEPTEAKRGSEEQAAELLAEQIAEGQDSVT